MENFIFCAADRNTFTGFYVKKKLFQKLVIIKAFNKQFKLNW